jgi:glycosyl hydrolase family 9
LRAVRGRSAAALALAAQSEPDPALRDRLIAEGRAWYAAGEQANKLAPRLPEDRYPSGSGNDDMALGAAELYRATGDPQDLADALDWLTGSTRPARPTGTRSSCWPRPSCAACWVCRRRARTPPRAAAGCCARVPRRPRAAPAATPSGRPACSTSARRRRTAAPACSRWRAIARGPPTRAILRDQRLPLRAGPFDGPGGVYEDRTPDYVTSEGALDYAASTVLLLAAVGPR